MTTIIFEKSRESYKTITCIGHAKHKRLWFEKDLVCASVSVLVLNTINALDALTDTNMEVTTNEETGFIRIVFMNSLSDKEKVLVDAMALGLEQICQEYGKKYCKVEFKEV